MTYQEKNSIVSIFSTLIIFIIYYLYIMQMYPQGTGISSSEILKYWGLVIILLVPVQVIIKIVITIVFNIINRIVTNEQEPTITDELDRLIYLKVVRNTCYSFLIVFFVAMGTLVIELPITVMFHILLIGLIGSGIIAEISQLIYYRKGV